MSTSNNGAGRQTTWEAGTGAVRFTPAEPVWLAGYLARTEPARGTLSDLYASALALRDAAGNTLVMASVDIIAIPVAIADAAAVRVRQRFPGVPRENFVFAATHTHYGPEIRPDKVVFFKIPPEYAAKVPLMAGRLVEAIAEAMTRGLEGLAPVRVYARRTEAGFAHNRRPQGGTDVFDHEVPVLDVRDAEDGSVKAVVFGYACHNTTMDPQERLYSADWAGFAKRRLEQLHPGATALFVTGCGADQNPHPRGTQELSARYGEELAEAVNASLAGPAVAEVRPSLRVATEMVRFEMEPVTERGIEEALASGDAPRELKARYLKERLARGERLETSYMGPMQVARLGDEVLMVLMSGETVIDYAIRFKQEFSGVAPLVWVAGYCNDMYGYIPTRRIQREGGYEGGRANLWSWLPSPWTETVEENVTGAVARLVERVKGA